MLYDLFFKKILVFDVQIMLWQLNMDQLSSHSYEATPRNSTSNEQNQNMENILDTSVMVDPRKSVYYKPRPEDYDVEDS